MQRTIKTVTLATLVGMLGGLAAGLYPTEAKAETCECYGYWLCSTTSEQYDYEAAGCGGMTKPTAQSYCQNRCSGGTCSDSGWICP